MQSRAINPWTWQDAFGFSQAVETTGHTRVLRCAGQTSVNAAGEPVHESDMAAQIGQAFDNLEAVLSQAGMTLANVVRLNFYVTDMDAFFEHFGVVMQRTGALEPRPAGTLLGVTRLAFPGLMVEIEATAAA